MLKIYDRFSPRANAADTDYPFGSFKNETIPGARDGTPLNADWANDHEGFDTALLAEAGITPNGLPDTAIASQRLDALLSLFAQAKDYTINAAIFGFKEGNTPAANGTAIRSACAAAAVVVRNTSVATVDLVTAYVYIPSGVYEFDQLEYYNGVEIIGQSLASTVLIHKGTSHAVVQNATGFKFGVWLRNLTFIGEKVSGRHGFMGNGMIRTCGLDRVLFDGFDRNIFNTSCWTMQIDTCQGQHALTNNVYWDGATSAVIKDCRFDVAGGDNIVISNDTVDTEDVHIVRVKSQASQGSGLFLSGIKSATVEGGFYEALKQDGINDKAYIHADMGATGASSLVLDNPYINQGASGGGALAGVYVNNVRNLKAYLTLQAQASMVVGVSLGANIESYKVEGQINAATPIADATPSTTLKTRRYNTAVGYKSSLEVGVGEGYFKCGNIRRVRRETSSNISSASTDGSVMINTTGGVRTYTVRSADISVNGWTSDVINIGSNILNISTEGAQTVNGLASLALPAGVGNKAEIISNGSNLFVTITINP